MTLSLYPGGAPSRLRTLCGGLVGSLLLPSAALALPHIPLALKAEDGVSGTTFGETITVRYGGGHIGNEAMSVSGLNIPKTNERFAMLLKLASGVSGISPVLAP